MLGPAFKNLVPTHGAVERFTGRNSVTSYPIRVPVKDPNNPEFKKFQVVRLKTSQDVYASAGLGTVWDTINRLKGLVGDLLLGPKFGDWSILNALHVTSGGNSVGGLMNFLKNTKPKPESPLPGSLRNFFETSHFPAQHLKA
jgi:hypothetical protein